MIFCELLREHIGRGTTSLVPAKFSFTFIHSSDFFWAKELRDMIAALAVLKV
jgi:hypothetical protein